MEECKDVIQTVQVPHLSWRDEGAHLSVSTRLAVFKFSFHRLAQRHQHQSTCQCLRLAQLDGLRLSPVANQAVFSNLKTKKTKTEMVTKTCY